MLCVQNCGSSYYQFLIMQEKNIYTDTLTLNLNEHTCNAQVLRDSLKLTVRNQQNSKEMVGNLNNQSLTKHITTYFNNVNQIFEFLTDLKQLGSGIQQKCYVKDSVLFLKISENQKEKQTVEQVVQIQLAYKQEQMSGYQKLKNGIISEELNQFRLSRMTKPKIEIENNNKLQTPNALKQTSLQPISASNLTEQCKWEFSKINSKITIMAQALQEHAKQISSLNQKTNFGSLQTVLNSYENRQDIILTKLTKISEEIVKLRFDKKQTNKKFEEQTNEMWAQINRVREMLKNPTNRSHGEYSLSQINSSILSEITRQQQSSIKSQNLKQTLQKLQSSESDVISEQKPIQFTRKLELMNNSTFIQANTSFALTEDEIERFKAGLGDLSIFRKKIRQLEKKIDCTISPTQFSLDLSKCKFHHEFIFQKQDDTIIVTKSASDKKCQLIGQALPSHGRFYYKLQLINVPHGYIHFGIISGQNLNEASSHESPYCINYFGGNGSLNDKGNGIFFGKEINDQDIVTVIIDFDAKKLIFMLKRQILAQASLKGFISEYKLYPYIQLFYGESKIKIIND